MQFLAQEHPLDPGTRAAQYLRMSTEHQQYSFDNQADAIRNYAAARGMQVVRTYADAGRSGLTFKHRRGLRALLGDVELGRADYAAVLVYDVSRWGRFQDADESAYYEYLCKRAGVAVHYCAEPFENDGSLPATLIKTLKRTMAAEYSRELSVKVFAGKCRLIELGFRQGGQAGFGLRRLLVDSSGRSKGLLKHGELKSIFTDRVILVPGPPDEVAMVREIFERFAKGQQSPGAIARFLNQQGVSREDGRRWNLSMVRTMLSNPKYIGANVSNRTSCKLGRRHKRNPPEMWIRRDRAFTPIVEDSLFQQAQDVIAARNRRYSDEDLIANLRDLLRIDGSLTATVLNQTRSGPSKWHYTKRFGGLLRAYQQIEYVPKINYSFVIENESLVHLLGAHTEELVCRLLTCGARVERRERGVLAVNSEFTVGLVLVRCRRTKHRGLRWILRPRTYPTADVILAARMTPDNERVLDYYVIPSSVALGAWVELGVRNSFLVDVHRFDDYSVLLNLIGRPLGGKQ